MARDDQLLFQLGLDPDLSAVNKAVQKVGDALAKGSLTLGGAAVGGAVGGPLGALAGGIAGRYLGSMMTNASGGVGGLAGRVAAGGLDLVANALHSLEEPLGPVALGLNLASTGLNEMSKFVKSIPLVGGLLGPLTDVLAGVPGILKDITGTLVSFAAKVAPGTFRQMQLAVESVQATIGQAFVPALELLRDGIGDFADVLANLIPSTGEVRAALAEFRVVFADTAKMLKAAAAEAGPTIRGALIEGLKQLAHWAAVAVKAIGMLAERLRLHFAAANAAAGPGVDNAERQRTLPAAPASIQGLAEYQRALQTASYSQGGGRTPAQETLDVLKSLETIDRDAAALLTNIDAGWDWMKGAWKDVEKGWSSVVTAVRSVEQVTRIIASFITKKNDLLHPTQALVDVSKKSERAISKYAELQQRMEADAVERQKIGIAVAGTLGGLF